MFLYNKSKNFFSKLISGGFGLPVTFWVFGVLFALSLNFLAENATSLTQLVLVAVIMTIHAVLIPISVWRAANLYSGNTIWRWSAKLLAIANIVKWLWYLPELANVFLNASGIQIYSNDYWVLDVHNQTCKPALYKHTPENIMKRYKDCYDESNNPEIVLLRCKLDVGNNGVLYTRNLESCEKYLNRLKLYYKDKK